MSQKHKTRTLLVDSSWLLKRSMDGAKDAYTKAGHIGGLYSFMTTVRKFIKEHSRNKVILFWDGDNGGVFRYELDREYKANHKNKSWYKPIQLTEEEIKREEEKTISTLWQKKRIQAYAEELYIRQIEVPKVEADDLIAKYCTDNHQKESIILMTNDKDFCQLLDLDIEIYLDHKKELIDRNSFFIYFKYHYSNSLAIKIVCGDDSDNIKGVGGVREKTLFKHFPEMKKQPVMVNDIFKKAKEINEARKKPLKPLMALSNIVNGKSRMLLNHRLINLKRPFLTRRAINELSQLDMPLNDETRGSKQLLKFMEEDGFLELFSNYGNFVTYIEPFYPVIMNEKKMLKEYYKTG